MTNDPRCCGGGACIVDAEGRCWCGQQWDGEKMCHVPLPSLRPEEPPAETRSSPALPAA